MNPTINHDIIEAQKDQPTHYDIINRAIFYVSRLISSQKGRDFDNTSYNDIKRVYSIWICMNMDKNTMNYIHLVDDSVLGNYKWNGKIDLINIVMIGLSNEIPEYNAENELHRLLGALFSKKLTLDKKMKIIETEYSIPIEEDLRKEVNVMCNLGEGIWEEAWKEAWEEAWEEASKETSRKIKGIVYNLYKSNLSYEQISKATELSIEEVKEIIENSESN